MGLPIDDAQDEYVPEEVEELQEQDGDEHLVLHPPRHPDVVQR